MSLNIRKMVYCALCIALGVLLPILFHMMQLTGIIFLPMHIPVLLCGIICGLPYGIICGLVVPMLSSLLTGMPPAMMVPTMTLELAAYGAASSLLICWVKTGKTLFNIYITLIGAMFIGRAVFGLANAFYFQAGAYSFQAWFMVVFTTSLPGIIIQLIAIPVIVMALRKAKLVTL